MKIVFLINNYPPRIGGLEQHVYSLATRLVGLGHSISVLTLGERTEVNIEDGITVYRFKELVQVDGVLGFPTLGATAGLFSALKKINPDIISVHTRFFTLTWLGVLWSKLLKIPVLHTEHGSGFVVSGSPVIGAASRLVDYTLGRASLRAASGVVCVSEPSQRFVEKLAQVSPALFYNVSPLPMRSSGDIVLDRKRLVFLARVVEVKGWRDFLDAVALVRAQDPEVHAVVLGDGADRAKAESYARELGIAEAVDFRGFVDHAEVARILRGATLVNPTVAAEGFQTTIIDAFVSHAGIVTYDVSSARVLEQRGVPVRIVTERGPQQLAEAVRQEIITPPAPYSDDEIKNWGWEHQAKLYEEYAQHIVNRGT
ncbi:glycosyltransferase family 4 protein [Rothia sp. ZJ932]|uniref:glycosyltransferase family 4 protein n=1 Tax=Rothia sp. ZJ932 TaxID=2810516 RepID=UPI0019680E3F|nr:glycosyltransferase family 4 protein [Rothia sp. ZJ932]QRZ61624.1 glycosyltransferase family 4 protein [Rothia sp. ZJ932]